ncbi:xylulose kinase-like [Tropilaelaps mercedesae]|uniref:Xylulose kinase n=1 Tax=Tropilaelaps mercedesae TaxID=418985 RepID=A0A1V9XSA8_9ACAR|nr:xylulose kinase-like [Tropilaelaps mercedesae]
MVDNPKYYLGLDLSTQQLKAAVIETVCDRRSSAESYPPPLVKTLIVCEENVIFDRLGFGTTSGVYCKGPYTVVAPTRMWIVALDMLLNKLRSKVDLSRVLCIGGCAQQHGTVYWGDAAKLREMSPLRSLQENLEGAFTVLDSPIWMDSSTTRECRAMEAAVGGAQRLAQLTGSRAYERFSGPQIARIARQLPCQYQRTQRISLVSSFLSSIFIGDIAPIDVSDASGMNLMDVRTNSWSYTCVRACFAQNPPEKRDEAARDLLNKLGNAAGLIPSGADLGSVSKYMQSRFGFGAHCHVAAFTEKNQPGLLQGHLMVNPLDPTRLMMMLCFKNGSLMRDNIVKELAEDHWARFNELLGFTPPGNLGKVGVYYDYPEILPERHGRYRFDVSGPEPILVERPFAPEEEVRALIEGLYPP